MATKIFVRQRRKVEKGEKKPRFRVVGVAGPDLKVYVKHVRKKELEQIAAESSAQVVFLDAGRDREKERGKSGADPVSPV
jgi:hypothetical protein